MSENSKNVCHNFPALPALSALFCLTISPKPKVLHLNYVKQRESTNLYISEAGTTDSLPFVLGKWLDYSIDNTSTNHCYNTVAW